MIFVRTILKRRGVQSARRNCGSGKSARGMVIAFIAAGVLAACGNASDTHFKQSEFAVGPDPEITSPVAGSTLAGGTVTFNWTANSTVVTQWWLYVGITQGTSFIFDSGTLPSTTLSQAVSNIPTAGQDIWVRLWYMVSGVWQFLDVQYDAAAPTITSPAPGGTIPGTSSSVSWSANGAAVDEYMLWAYDGGTMYYNSNSLGLATSTTVTGLPTTGGTYFLRLWYRQGTKWSYSDAQYTGLAPVMTSPVAGSTFSGSTQTFQWSANGITVAEWWLYVGLVKGAKFIHDSGSLGTNTSQTVTTLPTNGATVWVRLWYRTGSLWRYIDLEYKASGQTMIPSMTSPVPDSVISGSSVSFSWAANGLAVTQWWLYAGSFLGSASYYDSGSLGLATSAAATGLPTDGKWVYIRLWYIYAGSGWKYRDYLYQSSPVCTLSGTFSLFDEYQYVSGEDSRAGGLVLNSSGHLFVAGTVLDGTDVEHRIVRRSTNGGASWSVVDDYQLSAGKASYGGAIVISASGTLYTSGSATDASDLRHWIVRRSTDGGTSWSTLDDYQLSSSHNALGGAVYLAPLSGHLFVVGNANDASDLTHWIVRRSTDGGTSWSTVDDFQLSSTWHSAGRSIVEDRFGNLYAAGYGYDAQLKGRWIVRKSTNGGTTWSTVDNFVKVAGFDATAAAITTDFAGNIYVAGSVKEALGGPWGWVVRKSTNGGTTWSIVNEYRLDASRSAVVNNLRSDIFGNIYVTGWAEDGSGVFHWIVRRSADAGATWGTIDDYMKAGGTDSSAGSIGNDTSGNVYIMGYGKDATSQHWTIRKMDCVP